MNQKDSPFSSQSRQRDRSGRQVRTSRPDRLGVLSSLVSNDDPQSEVTRSLSDARRQKDSNLRQSTTARQTFSPLGCISKHYGLVTSPLERIDTKHRNLYSSASDTYSRGSSLDASSQEIPDGQELQASNQVRTLQQRNEMCVRRALSQDWLRKTFSPRPCKVGKKGTIGSIVVRSQHSLARICEEREPHGREGSDISDTKAGVEEDEEVEEVEEVEELIESTATLGMRSSSSNTDSLPPEC